MTSIIMATILKCWRESATLVLVSLPKRGIDRVKFNPVTAKINDNDNVQKFNLSNTGNRGGDFDVLLLKRSSRSAFMPNLYVFPGGLADDYDFDREWYNILSQAGETALSNLFRFVRGNGPGCSIFSRVRNPKFTSIPSEVAFRICAIRETFEESGVLLARKVSNLDRISSLFNKNEPVTGNTINIKDSDSWREKVAKDPKEFITLCRHFKIVPDVWALYEWANWLTPCHAIHPGLKVSFNKRRYDTAFFMCCVDEQPAVSEDKEETVHSQWGSPVHILQQYENDWAGLAAPQLYELSRLLRFPTLRGLHWYAWSMSSRRTYRNLSVLVRYPDTFAYVMPGDDLFPEQPDYEGTQDELIMSLSLEDSNKQYPNHHQFQGVLDRKGRISYEIVCNIEMLDHRLSVPTYDDHCRLLSNGPNSKL